MPSEKPARGARAGGTLVEDDTGRRPFMRGIMVHSLLSRGASFEDAYRVASEVRDKIRGRGVVRREELAALVESSFRDGNGLEEKRPPSLPPAMRVTEPGAATPFSKGVLSQSLLAAAVEANEAFDVARDIEAELFRRRVLEIDRTELRELVASTLERRLSPRAAMRYRVWRAFQESEKPMILLLAGAAGVGKTSLAQEVAHRLGIARVTSTDAIRQVMRIMLSPELVPAIHASSYDAWRVVGGLERSEDPVIEAFRAQATTVSVGVRAMMDRAVAENTSMILDGVSVLPGLIDLEAYRKRAFVIFLVVATLDEKAFRERFAARARGAKSRPEHRYVENLEAILRIQDYILELAEEHGVPIVDNTAFETSVLSILRHVAGTLHKQGGFGGSGEV